MIEDLTMLANQPVVDTKAAADAKAEADKAAASETMPPPKRKRAGRAADSKAKRVARRGQDPPAPEPAGSTNS